MSRSTDPGHFFLTEDAISKAKRQSAKASNSSGQPFKLSSKGLAVIAGKDATNPKVYIAESAGVVTALQVEPWKKLTTYRGPTAPLTCLCLSSSGNTLYAGCWDKTIYAWDVKTRETVQRFKGHADFVKAVTYVKLTNDRELLVSGSADGAIFVWDPESGAPLCKLRGHARGVQDLLLWPGLSMGSLKEQSDGPECVLLSAGSEREIKRWTVRCNATSGSITGEQLSDPWLLHETSVYRLRASVPRITQGLGPGFREAVALYSASADKSAGITPISCLEVDEDGRATRKMEHPDFVRDLVLGVQDDDYYTGHMRYVITACRDEHIRVWNNPAENDDPLELLHTLSGHFDEVSGLAVAGWTLISVAIDCTARKWILETEEMEKIENDARDAEEPGGSPKDDVGRASEQDNVKKDVGLTEEERRELAELME